MASLHRLTCPRCGHRSTKEVKFCQECGAELLVSERVHRKGRIEIWLAVVALGASILSFLAWLVVVIRPGLFPERLGELATSAVGVIWAALNLGILAYAAAQLEPRTNDTADLAGKGKNMGSETPHRQISVKDESQTQIVSGSGASAQATGKGHILNLSGSTILAIITVVTVMITLVAIVWILRQPVSPSMPGPNMAPIVASGVATDTSTPSPVPPPLTDTVTPTQTPIPPTSTWTSSPTPSSTHTSTASPVPPSPTPTPTRTPNPPTNTWTPTPIPPTSTWTPRPSSTWTSAPTATRPAPTNTPIPRPPTATPRTYPAPRLVSPADGESFPAETTVTLQWASVGPLGAGDHYLLAVQHSAGTSWVVTNNTSWVAPAWLKDYQPVTWWVMVCRGAAPGEYDVQVGSLASPSSEQRRFSWNTSSGDGRATDPPPKATDSPP